MILMEANTVERNEKWAVSTYFWMGIVVWFCANLLSQAVFMGKFGEPYGRELLDQGTKSDVLGFDNS